jgi:hypothetical protein
MSGSTALLVMSLMYVSSGRGHTTVLVFDSAGVAADTLQAAADTAAHLFSRQAVDIRWVVCRSGPAHRAECGKPDGTARLLVRVLPHADRYPVSPAVFGVALQTDSSEAAKHAVVFYDRLTEAAQKARCLVSNVLGYVLAHEVGHLLLGAGKHSASGIMAADGHVKI